MKIALAQINTTVGDLAGNEAKILAAYRRGVEGGVELVMFPELCVCGYPPADLLEKSSFVARAGETLEQIAEGAKSGPAVLCGTVMPTGAADGKRVRNVAALLEGGEVRFVTVGCGRFWSAVGRVSSRRRGAR